MKFNLQTPPPKPGFSPGDHEGPVTILAVAGHMHNNLAQKQWWYHARCKCGHEFTISQKTLRDTARCPACGEKRVTARKPRPREPHPASLPRFERIKLR